jgi:hypothetical protein
VLRGDRKHLEGDRRRRDDFIGAFGIQPLEIWAARVGSLTRLGDDLTKLIWSPASSLATPRCDLLPVRQKLSRVVDAVVSYRVFL